MWDLLLTGAHSPDEIRRIAADAWGLKPPPRKRKFSGGPIPLSSVYRMFSNPFYAGVIVWNGEWSEGKHRPMITLAQFNQAQALIGRSDHARPQSHEFAFTGGLIRCACGLSVTAEEKTKPSGKRYVYYRCTRRGQVRCSQPAVRCEALEAAIMNVLQDLRLTPSMERWFENQLEVGKHESDVASKLAAQTATRALAAVENESKALLDLRLRGIIGDDEFASKRKVLQAEILERRRTVDRAGREDSVWFELARAVVLFRKYAVRWFQEGNAAEKRLVLQTLGSNCMLADGKLNISARFPFKECVADPKFLIRSPRREDVRTPEPVDKVEWLIQAVRYLEGGRFTNPRKSAPPLFAESTSGRKPPASSVRDVRQRALHLVTGQLDPLRDKAA